MITFSGYQLSPLQRSMLSEATEFTLDFYMSSRLKKSLNINIHIVKDMYSKEKTWGDVEVEEDGEYSPKNYNVRLSYSGVKSFYKMLVVLVHEIIHVKQYAKREIRHLSAPFHVAYGKTRYDVLVVSYDDRPWEVEAHAFEELIAQNFLKKSERVNKYVKQKTDVDFMRGY